MGWRKKILGGALTGSKKTTIAGLVIAVLTLAGMNNEQAQAIANVVVPLIAAIGLFTARDHDAKD